MTDKQPLTLAEVLRSYPHGGLPGLARDSGMHVETLRDFGNHRHKAIPWRTLYAVADVGLWDGAPQNVDEWRALWENTAKES